MSEKIEKIFKENKVILLIILLLSFQISPFISLIAPNSPMLARILGDIVPIICLILCGTQWLSELSPKLVEDLSSMELDKEILFKHNAAIIISTAVVILAITTAYIPQINSIQSHVIREIALVLLIISIYLKGKYAQGKQEKKVNGMVIFFAVLLLVNSFLLYILFK